jgi:Domain of unknown function (DUF4112)
MRESQQSLDTDPDQSPPSTGELADELRNRARSSKKISWLLDECIRVPGTSLRFGLDPIIGLLPYGGETLASLIGLVILGEARKKGLPFKTLARMGGNMLVNAGVGTIPILGDLFSVWFKSNTRNYRMINTFLDSEDGSEVPGGWWPTILVGAIFCAVILLNVIAWVIYFQIFYWLFKAAGTV